MLAVMRLAPPSGPLEAHAASRPQSPEKNTHTTMPAHANQLPRVTVLPVGRWGGVGQGVPRAVTSRAVPQERFVVYKRGTRIALLAGGWAGERRRSARRQLAQPPRGQPPSA